jgi:hypothetical protein
VLLWGVTPEPDAPDWVTAGVWFALPVVGTTKICSDGVAVGAGEHW